MPHYLLPGPWEKKIMVLIPDWPNYILPVRKQFYNPKSNQFETLTINTHMNTLWKEIITLWYNMLIIVMMILAKLVNVRHESYSKFIPEILGQKCYYKLIPTPDWFRSVTFRRNSRFWEVALQVFNLNYTYIFWICNVSRDTDFVDLW